MSKEGKDPRKPSAKEVAKEWWKAMGNVEAGDVFADFIPASSKPRQQPKPSTSKEVKKVQANQQHEPMEAEEVEKLLKNDDGTGESSADSAAAEASMALLESGELGPLTEEQERALAEKNRENVDSDDDESMQMGAGPGPGPSTKDDKGKKSYVKAVKKQKLDQDLILYVQLGREKREILPKAIWENFAEGLTKALLNMDVKDVASIGIEWMDYHLGRGIIACSDVKTSAWLKNLAQAFNHEGSTVRAWSRNEFGVRTVYSGFLHDKRWWNLRGPSALKWIMEINSLDQLGKFQVLTYTKKPNGVWIRFEGEDSLIAGIDAKNLTLKAGWCTLYLEKKVNNLSITDEGLDKNKKTEQKKPNSATTN